MGLNSKFACEKKMYKSQFRAKCAIDNSMEEKLKNGGFTLKAHQMFSVHTTLEELRTQQSPVILDLIF